MWIYDVARNCRRWVPARIVTGWRDWAIGHPLWRAPIVHAVIGAIACGGTGPWQAPAPVVAIPPPYAVPLGFISPLGGFLPYFAQGGFGDIGGESYGGGGAGYAPGSGGAGAALGPVGAGNAPLPLAALLPAPGGPAVPVSLLVPAAAREDVPEPWTLVMLAGPAVALAAWRKRPV